MTVKPIKCGYCDKPIEYSGTGRPPATCMSVECFTKHREYVKQQTAICPTCKRTFSKGPLGDRPSFAVYCNDVCRGLEVAKSRQISRSSKLAVCIHKGCNRKPSMKGADYCSEEHYLSDYTTDDPKKAAKIKGWPMCPGPGCGIPLMGSKKLLRGAPTKCSSGCRHNVWLVHEGQQSRPELIGKAYNIKTDSIIAPRVPSIIKKVRVQLTIEKVSELWAKNYHQLLVATGNRPGRAAKADGDYTEPGQVTPKQLLDSSRNLAVSMHNMAMCQYFHALALLQIPSRRTHHIDLLGWTPVISYMQGGASGSKKVAASYALKNAQRPVQTFRATTYAELEELTAHVGKLSTNYYEHIGTVNPIRQIELNLPEVKAMLDNAVDTLMYAVDQQVNKLEQERLARRTIVDDKFKITWEDCVPMFTQQFREGQTLKTSKWLSGCPANTWQGTLAILVAAFIKQLNDYQAWSDNTLNIEGAQYDTTELLRRIQGQTAFLEAALFGTKETATVQQAVKYIRTFTQQAEANSGGNGSDNGSATPRKRKASTATVPSKGKRKIQKGSVR